MSDVTQILSAVGEGNGQAAEQLLPLVYDELRKLAAQKIAQEKPGQTLQATALLHEAYVRLVDSNHPQAWDSRGHFFAAAAEAMRRILVDRAREKVAEKRGGSYQRIDFDPSLAVTADCQTVLDLHEALQILEKHDAEAASLVKLRYFAGVTHADAAEFLGISRRQADRLWIIAKTWLYRQLSEH